MDTNELLIRYTKGERFFRNISLRGATQNFEGANLLGIDLQMSILHEINLEDANVEGANFQGTTFEYVNCQKANFQKANLRESNLQYANLEEAKLQEANLIHAQLQGTRLQRANLQRANLSAANLRGADLREADLRGADFTAANLEETNFQKANYDKTTKWPSIRMLNKAIFLDRVIPDTQIIYLKDTEKYLTINGIKALITFQEAKNQIHKAIHQRFTGRQGQSKFRRNLLKAYKSRCAITGCEIEEALEAAHIIPYCITKDNDISNGLLLRSDLHTLFDFNLIVIDPETKAIHLDSRLQRSDTYQKLLEQKYLQQSIRHLPEKKALEWRRDEYRKLLK